MAEEVLFETLEGNIPLEEVLSWVTNETCGPILQEKLSCSRGDFVMCIINYLRQSTAGSWQQSETFSSPIKSASKHVKFSLSNRRPAPQGSANRQYVRRVELFPKPEPTIESNSQADLCCDLSPSGTSKTQSPSLYRESGGKLTSKNRVKNENNPFLVPEVSFSATSSPLSISNISDGSPQFTQINKRVQVCRSSEKRSPQVASSTPDYQFKTPTRNNVMCLGDFIVKSGKSKKRISVSPTGISATSPNLSGEDNQSCQSNKRKHRRRINPTKVSQETTSSETGFQKLEPFGTASRSLSEASPFKAPVSMEPSGASQSFSEERSLLKQERLKLLNHGENASIQTVPSSVASKSITSKSIVLPDPLKVTHSDQLLAMKDLYCSVLNSNLVPNLMSELYFIVSLLIIRGDLNFEDIEDSVSNVENSLQVISLEQAEGRSNDTVECISSPIASRKQTKRTNFLHSVHNCVFFACQVLAQQKDVLRNLDRITLKLLLDSERIALFTPQLRGFLSFLYSSTVSVSRCIPGIVSNKAAISGNVSFQSDTDNSSNFPSTQCFSTFRKQRDGFYELLRIWEANHLKPGWCFATTLGNRVRSLVQLCSDPINLMHFARLFRLQLVSFVSGDSNNFDEGPEDLQFLEELKGVDPSKLNRLRGRLITPYKSGGPRPAPSFPGLQEFYRDFIVSSCHSSFMQHLQDSLISDLLELNQTTFLASDTEESDLSVDGITRQSYLSSVITMRLLAKFLGFIVFLPYSRPETAIPQNIVETEVSVRAKVMPPLNVVKCVVEAHKSHRLIVTIPWVVKFLGMMDPVSCTLPIYQNVLQFLLHLYISLKNGKWVTLFGKKLMLPAQSILLLRLSLGWLFEASFIQESFFYSWCFNLDESLLLMSLDVCETSIADHSLPALDSSDVLSISSSTAPPVDALNLVDCEVLYALCPFLLELRALLASTPSSERTPGSSVRHITPVSAGSALTASASSSIKQMELKLEDSFFHGLPASVHRTVEFVVERVTSSCVKHICNVWLPGLKQKGIAQLQEKIKSYESDKEIGTSASVIHSELRKEISAIVDQVSVDLKAKCRSGVGEFCSMKCKGALMSLLPEESLSLPVCEICVSIASRMSEERVITWMQTHATLSLYSKDLESEADKAFKNRDRYDTVASSKTSHIALGASAPWKHDDSVPSPSALLQTLKLMVGDILNGREVSKEDIYNILDKMEQCVTKRQDVVPAAERILALLSVDLVVSLVCRKPLMVDSTLLSRLISLWKLDALRPVEDGLSRLVCPRNMLLLAQSEHPTRLVWEKLAEVVATVLKANLVTPDLVENQCLAIMQQEWPQNILRSFAMCMNEVVRQYQKQRDVNYKFVLLLEWLSETMAQMDYFPHL